MDNRITELEKEIGLIKERNKKVEINKAWETSSTRRLCVAIITYLFLGVTMVVIGTSRPWIDCIIPTLGFLLGSLSLDFVRKIWEKE
ncbi:MAG: hypothetical protein PHF46_01500 [Candidatus Gracilibacteria bacterium]|nr:hypothetical protein [Candidatus Gracilibacteria bacterium]MDD3120067.1 hypothetical protein [Candidatus Gracilibacteria bacterium]MDD4530232.1 hypothetical protein [Candidatus Gracilibacteria bacterium]